MSNTLTIESNSYSTDVNDLISEESSYNIDSTWTVEQSGTLSIATATTLQIVTFTNLTTATFIRIHTDNVITVSLTTTGGALSAITVESDLILTTTGLTAMKISNASGFTAVVYYEMRG